MNAHPLSFPKELPARLKHLLEGCLAVDISKRLNSDQLFSDEFVEIILANPEHHEEDFQSNPSSMKSSMKHLSIKQVRPESKSTSIQESSEESTGLPQTPTQVSKPVLTLH